jgi:hypothetical protein
MSELWQSIDWQALERLRAAFLNRTAGAGDYWLCRRDLDSYDQTFAQRIGWKWDWLLAELDRRAWAPPPGPVLDWGCGSGVAGRAFLDHYGADAHSPLWLHDRSLLAVEYAAERARVKYPGLAVAAAPPEARPAVLLLSHVLSELSAPAFSALLEVIRRATAVLWVESGDYETSRALIAAREVLRADFQVAAPCTHQQRCGLLDPENAPHWCHHFASPPPEIFADGDWVRFGQLAGVDLRSLPLSCLVLDRRRLPPLPEGSFRLIGRPRLYKPNALLLGCDAAGVREASLSRRDHPEAWRRLKNGDYPTLLRWHTAHHQIQTLHMEEASPPGGS